MKIKQMLLGVLALCCACAFGENTKDGESPDIAVQKLQTCDFLLNKDFKKDAKYYLCLFSASWCPPCRAEMPRIAKTYAETLKDDPNIELIHFSRDSDEGKALAWAKEHDVKFPVVKYNGGNPLDLHTRGIPHLFIVKADGTLIEEGHPMKLFTEEKLNALKAGEPTEPETATEKTRKAIAKLFPGWSLDSEVPQGDGQPEHSSGFHASHRGRNNIIRLHPMNRETPVVLSRMVKLPDTNPCLALSVASWNDDADFLLSVRVNGKDALTNRLICTSDAVPWEDIVVPLSAWRGSSVKLEIILSANNWWWCEWSHLARIDIIEADGDMSVKEGKLEVDGYTWSYRAQNGEATIVAENDGRFSTAVSPCPVGSITIPAELAGAKVTHIGKNAFRDCSALTSVTIPEGVVRIGRNAFRDCTGLKSVDVPSSVKIIESDAFAGCGALASVSIPDGVKIIDRGAFFWCCGLESIEIPSSVTQIGRDAFYCCRGLASVTIPGKVVDIGSAAFHGCTALASVTIPASVTNIDSTAFRNTGALTSLQVDPGNRFYKSENGLLLTKDGTTLVRGVNGDALIPPRVTAIGPCAFEGCVALRSIVIPPGVKSIGPFAFKQCRGMKSVTIPESVTDIGNEAFSTCMNLKSIAIPQGVTVIRNSTFSGSALTEVVIPSNVKVLERGAFSWCGELSSVTFPEGMTSIGRDAFYNCGKLTSLTIPSSVRRVEQGAFHGCGELANVTMRGERPDAPNNIFMGCGKLKAIHVPASAKSWAGMKEWLGISLVFDVDVKDKSTSDVAKKDEVELPYMVVDGAVVLVLQHGRLLSRRENWKEGKYVAEISSGALAIPDVIDGLPVRGIGYGAFSDCKGVLSVAIPSSVTNIVDGAFFGCNEITSFSVDAANPSYSSRGGLLCSKDGTILVSGINGEVTIPSCVTSIMRSAFNGRNGLTSVTIPSGVTNIGFYAFYNCSALESVTIPSSVKSIESDAFSGTPFYDNQPDGMVVLGGGVLYAYKGECPSSVTIPTNVTRIENYAFHDRRGLLLLSRRKSDKKSGLESVMIPSSVTSIGEHAFFGCNGLKSFSVAADNPSYKAVSGLLLTKDGKMLVAAPYDITNVTIPNGVSSIGEWAFGDCSDLTSVTIPNSVTSIGGSAFNGCTNLASVTIPSSVTSIGSMAFSCCTGLKSVMIPGSVTNIGGYAFFRCSSLTSVTIPNSVTSIGDYAFGGCSSLTSVTIPNSVTNINSRAFYGCKNIASVDVVKEGKVERVSFQDFCKQRKLSVDVGRGSLGSSLRERRALREQQRVAEEAKAAAEAARERARIEAAEREEAAKQAKRKAEREEQRREIELLKAELKAQKAAAEKARKYREAVELEVER